MTQNLAPGQQQFDVSGENSVPIPDGLLYTVSFSVGPAVTPAAYPLSGTPGGQIIVTTCTGDCNGNNLVSIGELQRCVSIFLGAPLCNLGNPIVSCPVADENNGGSVSLDEVQQCANRFLGDCE